MTQAALPEIVECFRHPAYRASVLDESYQRPPHVEALSEAIGEKIRQGNARLMVVMPPRHGKTQLCSRWTPLWFLELFPHKRVLLASYGAAFAAEHGRWVRNRLRDYGARGEVLTEIVSDSKAADRWDTPEGGGMATTGVGGPLTGRGADLLIIDDPVKDSEEARSETIKQKTWEWWQETARTRIEPGGSAIVIMTRWAEDDLVGRLLEQDRDGCVWTVVHLEAIAEGDDDPIGRLKGDPLWAERYPVEVLQDIRRDVGSYSWSALYQGRPAPAGGGMFRKADFRYWSFGDDGRYLLHHGDGRVEAVHPASCWRGQVVDTAMKEKTVNDYTVVFTYAVTPKRQVLVLDVTRERIEVPDQLPLIRTLRSRYKPRWTAVEDKGSGIGIIQEARRQGLALRPIKTPTDKVTRASSASALYEQHAIFHHRDAPWLGDFEHELLMFPNGTHDDQVDTVSHAVNELAPQGAVSMPVAAKSEDLTDMAVGDMAW